MEDEAQINKLKIALVQVSDKKSLKWCLFSSHIFNPLAATNYSSVSILVALPQRNLTSFQLKVSFSNFTSERDENFKYSIRVSKKKDFSLFSAFFN